MAPFNTNQVKYIQAVAGRQQHTTLRAINQNGVIKSNDFGGDFYVPQTFDTSDPLLLAQFYLHELPHAWDCRGVHNNDLLEAGDFTELPGVHAGFGKYVAELGALTVPCVAETGSDVDRADDAWVASTVRATPDGFLKSLNLKLRLTLPTNIPVAHPSWTEIEAILKRQTGSTTVSSVNYDDFWKGVLSEQAATKTIQSALDIFGRSHPMHTPHYEFRLIMFRNRLPTYRRLAGSNSLDAIRNGVSLLNPGYDLFMGQTGRPRGPLGYRTSVKLDKDMDPTGSPAPYYSGKRWSNDTSPHQYVNGVIPKSAGDAGHGNTAGAELFPDGEANFTHRDLMTMPLNKNDYVVMRDVRFFLGQSQGKSHFEDVFDFDFNDQINTADSNLLSSDTLADKNYRWQCVIIGTSNGKDPVHLNYEIRGTTHCQSG
tara:strand:- start:377 stop:1657 length:1281 start_codon:yes stop_codon:yes gene_type:complete